MLSSCAAIIEASYSIAPNPDKPEPKTKAHPDASGQSRQDNAKEKHLRVSLRFLCDLASLREFFAFSAKISFVTD
jgi:hypothetical protein